MRKNLCIVLILLICFITTLTYAEEEKNENNNTTNETTDLQTQRELLQNQLNEANADLTDVQSDISESLQQVQKLDEKISKSENELEEQESKITELKKTIEEIEKELNTVTEKYNNQKDLFEQRIVAIYEAGETKYLDILLKSKNITDFLSSYYVVSELAKVDEDLLNDIDDKKKKIDTSKKKLENEKTQLATIIENQTRTTRTLQNTRKMRESFLEKLSDEEKEIQNQIDEYNKQFEEINRQIIALSMDGIDTQYIGGTFAWPIPGYTKITSKYGMRVHPITGVYKLHTGVDVSAPEGANFIAANDGIVTKASFNTAYGNMVIINHGGGISTLYAHGSEILVEVGQTVKRGDPVLKVGSTGYSTGAHAHFEIRINGVTTDPMPYITNGLIPGDESSKNENSNTTENTTN
ncbi:MAG: peptidoglycan DD-metalloendopeptidase family protein [Clostridia bacterium]|nr:peptidoglycan DD-metalloendopeptidase family protein [Clostridia bacterium]